MLYLTKSYHIKLDLHLSSSRASMNDFYYTFECSSNNNHCIFFEFCWENCGDDV